MDSESGSAPGGDASSRVSDDSENDSPITSPSFTHNHAVADCHIKDFNHVLDALRSAAERLSTSDQSGHKYTSLHALLLSWEGDDLGVREEVSNLGSVLRDQYAFDVQRWEIPIKKSTIKLTKCIVDWTEEYEGEDKLLLMYYAGHGWMDTSRQAIWSNRRKRDEMYAELKWSGCEEVLHESVSDTLFLLDCCHAGSSISQALKGFSETIAASGFEYIAPLPGPHSFTNALTRILFEWSRMSQSFTVAALHAEILTYLKIIPPDQLTRDGLALATASTSMEMRTYEWRRTPVHYIRSTYKYISSIILAPKSEHREPPINLDGSHIPKPDNSPRVVLSISLTEDIRADDAESCRRWLTDFPLPTQDITVEAVFRSFSTVVLVSVALEVWDVLPEIPGCNFVCYSQSRNLLGITPMPDIAQRGVEHVQSHPWWSYFPSSAVSDVLGYYIESESGYGKRDDHYEFNFKVLYTLLRMFLQTTSKDEHVDHPPKQIRDKLSRLSTVQFRELSIDMYDELRRRKGPGRLGRILDLEPPPFLRPEIKFHPKRNEARRKLSTLRPTGFRELATDVFHEMDRRFPSFTQSDMLKESQRAGIVDLSGDRLERTPVQSITGVSSNVVSKPRKPGRRFRGPLTVSEEAIDEPRHTTTSKNMGPGEDSVDSGLGLPSPSPYSEAVLSAGGEETSNPFARSFDEAAIKEEKMAVGTLMFNPSNHFSNDTVLSPAIEDGSWETEVVDNSDRDLPTLRALGKKPVTELPPEIQRMEESSGRVNFASFSARQRNAFALLDAEGDSDSDKSPAIRNIAPTSRTGSPVRTEANTSRRRNTARKTNVLHE